MIDHHHFSFTANFDHDPDSLDEVPFASWADGIKDIDEGAHSDVSSSKLREYRSHHPATSRAVAIAGYRKEMMELVRDVPEPAYELSLKDMVELSPMTPTPRMETLQEGKAKKGVKKGASPRRMSRIDSMDAGVFLLKMFMPFSLGGGKRGKSSRRSGGSSGAGSSKISLKQVSGDRSSSSGSNNSSSSSSTNNSMNRKLTSCFSFFLGQKSKS